MINVPRLDGSGPRLPTSGGGQAAPSPPTPVTPVAASHVAGDIRQETFHRLNQIALAQLPLGKGLQAEVLSRLDERTFLLKLTDGTHQSAVRAGLPEGMRAGDTLQLRLVAIAPRPTFLLLDGAEGGSTPTLLSSGARMIDQALQHSRHDANAAAIAGKTPLLSAGANPDARQLAGSLQQALATSGLFYESHLRQWANGRRSLAQVQQEPQATLGNATGLGRTATTATAPQQVDIVSSWAAETAQAGNDANSRLLQLVGQQLHTLENQRLSWHGELWPGQRMEWAVEEEPRKQEEPNDVAEESARWTSTLKLELPSLGKVAVILQLDTGRLRLHIEAADPNTRQTLKTQGDFLADALDVAGMQLEALTVRSEPAP